jgi:alpha-tubulin suppressor-like RCC1 family protein
MSTRRGGTAGERLGCSWGDTGTLECSGDAELHNTPAVQDLDGVDAMAIGQSHACVVRAGEVACWGANNTGQLGVGSTDLLPLDELAQPLRGVFVEDICAGLAHTCVRTTAGGVLCWGQNSRGQIGTSGTPRAECGGRACEIRPHRIASLPPVADLACREETSCAMTSARELFCWGEFVSSDSPTLITTMEGG